MRSTVARAFHPLLRRFSPWVTAAIALAMLCGAARAERPSAMKLFPHDTLVFVRMANAHDFGERSQQTAMGRMIQDPQMKPFVEHLYGKAAELYAREAEGKIGITWDDLKKLPQGEVAFGVVAGDKQPVAMLLLVDQGNEPSVADKLLDRALDFADKNGGEFTKEKIGDVEITVVRDHNNQNRMFGVFQRENTIVVATDPSVLRNVLWHWDHPGETPSAAGDAASASANAPKKSATAEAAQSNEKIRKNAAAEFTPTRTLAENTRFATIVRECRRKQDPPPHLLFYTDPVGLVRGLGGNAGGGRFFMAMLAPLGIDGLSGLGGAVTLATDQYEELVQVHVLLENPRAGIMQLPAFESGETTPQSFVPKEMESYIAWRWNIRTTYDRVCALVDKFGTKGVVDKLVKEKASDKLGIDVVHQVIDNLKGRFTWLTGFDRPARLQGGQNLLAAELNDEKAMSDALQTVIKKFPELFEERKFGKVTYYAFTPRGIKDKPQDERPVDPFVAIMDGYLFVGGSCQQFERCVAAHDGTAERLVDSDEYKRTHEVIGRETAGTTPFMFSLNRSEESVRQWYDLLASPKTREKLTAVTANGQTKKNSFFAALADLYDEKQLPPFEVLAPYFGPGGGILYDTDNGYHGISFKLRNDAKP